MSHIAVAYIAVDKQTYMPYIPTLTLTRSKEPSITLSDKGGGSFWLGGNVVYLSYCKIFLIFLFRSFGR